METIEYRGFDIKIHYEDHPANPWEVCDCMIPIIVYSDGYFSCYDDIDDGVPELTAEQIRKNKDEILQELDYKNLIELSKDFRWDYHTAVEAINAAIEDHHDGLYKSDRLSFLGTVYTWAGVENYNTSSNGFCQSDYAELLIVATPKFLKDAGLKEYTEKQFKSDAELWGSWAWGSVYGYNIEPTDRNKNIDCDDSCWGFYGYDHEKSGLLESAKDSINWAIENYKKGVIAEKNRRMEINQFMRTAWAY